MNNKQLEYSLIISPNIKFELLSNSFRVKNEFNGNNVIFENNSIQYLLDYFSQPRKISDALDVMDGDIEDNKKVIKNLVEWDFLIVDLGLTERSCPLCQSNSNHLLIEHENEYYQKRFKYVKCDNCDFVFLNPAPNETALNFFYSFKNYYSVIPVTSSQKFERKLKIKSNILRTNLLQDYCLLDESIKILDVGCGTGNFASYLSERFNCNVTCIDKDPLALSFINNSFPKIKTLEIDFKHVTIESKFDLITMWGYIEHEFSPSATFTKAFELLNTGGYLIVDAPNIAGSLAKKSIKNWPYLHSPYHICHFEPKTISMIANKAGFDIIELKYKKTGTYLLKYSETILYLIYKHKLFYSSNVIDKIAFYISRLIVPFEKNYNNRLILIAKKK